MDHREKGKLKIFFSYAGSIGKTRAMLEAAQAAKAQGVDVVVGYLSRHAAAELPAPPDGLERLPCTRAGGREDFDPDQALARRPELILVDELAHTNGSGSRHRRRCQDVD